MANILIIRSVLSSWTSSQIRPALFVEIRKVLSKLFKEKGCEAIGEWIRSCENHLYWSTTTKFSAIGKVMWAKVSSFMSHIINKHSELSDALFNRCFSWNNLRLLAARRHRALAFLHRHDCLSLASLQLLTHNLLFLSETSESEQEFRLKSFKAIT